ncbi:MAG: hypothetical protein ACJAUP_000478 [Cellvibrionaceae bacterium]|jgi:hypothetical protein
MILNNGACLVDGGRMNLIINIQRIKTLEHVNQFLINTADAIITPP